MTGKYGLRILRKRKTIWTGGQADSPNVPRTGQMNVTWLADRQDDVLRSLLSPIHHSQRIKLWGVLVGLIGVWLWIGVGGAVEGWAQSGGLPPPPPGSGMSGEKDPAGTNQSEGQPTPSVPPEGQRTPSVPPGAPGNNPFFDVQPMQPPGAAAPPAKPQWPSLRRRISRAGGDHLARSYLVQEAAYIGYYERQGVRIAGFKVPERTQMLYLRRGDRFWNGTVVDIRPREVVVLYQPDPGEKEQRETIPRRGYMKTTVTAMGVDQPEKPGMPGSAPSRGGMTVPRSSESPRLRSLP